MRKKVLALVMGALAISTIGAFAQTETTTSTCTEQTQCSKEKKECKGKGHDKGKKHCDKKKRAGEKGRVNFFEGIELTAEQQQQIDALRTQQKAEREANKEKSREFVDGQHKQFNAEVEKILTPEQLTQYKANLNKMKERKAAKKNVKKAKANAKERKAATAEKTVVAPEKL